MIDKRETQHVVVPVDGIQMEWFITADRIVVASDDYWADIKRGLNDD